MNDKLPDTPALQLMLAKMLARELRLDPQAIDGDRPFTQYGLDSIAALTIAGDLEESLSVELASTLLWDCPTINTLAAHLGEMLRSRETAAVA